MRRVFLRFLQTLAAASATATAAPAQMTNISFEREVVGSTPVRPAEWAVEANGFEVTLDTLVARDGQRSLRSRYVAAEPFSSDGRHIALAVQMIPAGPLVGRRVRLTGWVRTADVHAGYAGLWLRLDGRGRAPVVDMRSARAPVGTTPWTRYVVELPVDSAASTVIYGAIHRGDGTAWFDSLSIDLVGGEALGPVMQPMGAPTDTVHLLTDAELRVPPDSTIPPVNDALAAWVREHASPIRSLHAEDVSDLEFLAPLVTGKRVVLLGESAHGVREFSLAKARLVRYLHERLGYDVLAFEAPLLACDDAGRTAARFTAHTLMRDCLPGVWHTADVLALLEYVRETQQTARPLVLAGFDVASYGAEVVLRRALIGRVIAAADSQYARRVVAIDSALWAELGPAGPFGPPVPLDGERLAALYDSVAAWLDAREPALARALPEEPYAPALARQAARSAAAFARQLAAGPSARATEVRDRGMADNIDFLLDELHPNARVIVWAHNGHVRRGGYGRGAAAPPTPVGSARSMGSYVAERRSSDAYAVGLFMYRGTAAYNNRVLYPIRRPDPGSLEAVLRQACWRYAFLDLSRASGEPGAAWVRTRVPALAYGAQPDAIVPRDEYDAILFIERVTPPPYVP